MVGAPFAGWFATPRTRDTVSGPASRSSDAFADDPAALDPCLPRHEPAVFQDVPQLCQRDSIPFLQVEDRQALIQADADGLHAGSFLHGHAHGVGADLSIHTQRSDFDVPQLATRGGRRQHDSNHKQDRTFHNAPHFSQKK